jgi:uncharacterized membrane protein YdjX (TVP38/TMEM64 family)
VTEPELRDPRRERSGLIGIGVLGAAWTALPALMGIWLLAELGTISAWLREHPGEGVLLFVAIFAVSAGLGLLPTYAQSILGGWVFGMAVGVPAALAGFVGGSLIGFAIVRLVARESVQRALDRRPRAAVIREALVGRGFLRTAAVVALLRMPPNSPFALSNLMMAAAGARLLPFLAGTAVGMLPRTAFAVWLAAAASSTGASDIQSFAAERGVLVIAVGIAAMAVSLAIVGSLANAALRRLAPEAAARG